MSNPVLYLLVEAEPYVSFCKDWRERWIKATQTALEMAESLGASGYFPGHEGEFQALTPVDPMPEGWTYARTPMDHAPRLVPLHGLAGKSARNLVAHLPSVPKSQEIATFIDHPCRIIYKSSLEAAEAYGFCGVGHWLPVNLAWAGDQFMIQVVDMQRVIDEYLDTYPDLVVEVGDWTPPAGLRPISKARWDFIEARENLDAEEQLIAA